MSTVAWTFPSSHVDEGAPPRIPLLVVRTAEGPFPMETTYTWEQLGERQTRMTLRNRGEPSGFGKLAAPLMAGAMRRAKRKDLERLKAILETTPSS